MSPVQGEWTDDSSRALGLGHGGTAEKEAYLREIGVENEANLQRIIPRNDGAAADLARRMAPYIAAGYGTVDAIELALQDASSDGIQEHAYRDAYLGASVEDLMRASVEPDHGGSRSHGRGKPTTRVPDPLDIATSLIRMMPT